MPVILFTVIFWYFRAFYGTMPVKTILRDPVNLQEFTRNFYGAVNTQFYGTR